MTTSALKLLAQVSVQTTATLIYQAPSGFQQGAITKEVGMWICNNQGVMSKLTLRLGKQGVTLTDAHNIMKESEVDPHVSFFISREALGVPAGYKLEALCDVNDAFTLTMFGEDVT